MGERSAKKWRIEQKWTEEPEIMIPEKMFEENARARRQKEEALIRQSIKDLSYRSTEGRSYTRNAQKARDGKGSIRGEGVQKKSRYPKRRLLAGTLAAIAIFGAAHEVITDDTPSYASTAMVQEAGVQASTLGLTPELVDKLKEYEAFFDQYDPSQPISEEEVLAKISEVDALKDEVLSSKLGALFGVAPEKVGKGHVYYDRDAQLVCNIKVGDDVYLSNSLLPIFKREDISKDIQDLLVLFDKIDTLSEKVSNDKISKSKAISRLGEKYFEPLEIIANSTFVHDKHNNVTVLYEKINEVNQEAKVAEERQAKEEKEDDGMEIGD